MTAKTWKVELTCVISPDVLASYGLFLQNSLNDHDAAEATYKESLRVHPSHLMTLQNYAIFLEEVRADFDGAEHMYNLALESTNMAVSLPRKPSAQH